MFTLNSSGRFPTNKVRLCTANYHKASVPTSGSDIADRKRVTAKMYAGNPEENLQDLYKGMRNGKSTVFGKST